jgi:hypothetical protein
MHAGRDHAWQLQGHETPLACMRIIMHDRKKKEIICMFKLAQRYVTGMLMMMLWCSPVKRVSNVLIHVQKFEIFGNWYP